MGVPPPNPGQGWPCTQICFGVARLQVSALRGASLASRDQQWWALCAMTSSGGRHTSATRAPASRLKASRRG